MKKKFQIQFFIQLFFSAFCFSQQQYTFTNYTQEQGLALGTIRGIYKDTTGYIWLTSEEGVTRFDGYNFKIFRHNPDDSTSLPDNITQYAAFTSYGDNYFFSNSGPCLYDPLSLSFTHKFPFGDSIKVFKQDETKDNREFYWILSDNNLIKVNKTKCNFYRLPFSFKGKDYIMISDRASRVFLFERWTNHVFLFDQISKIFLKINFLDNFNQPDTAALSECVFMGGSNFIALNKNYLRWRIVQCKHE